MDKVSYWVDDTFDSELKHGIYVMAGTNIEEGENFLLTYQVLSDILMERKNFLMKFR
jgi:hypothetical protein